MSAPTITIQPKPQAVSEGSTAAFDVRALNAESYQWKKDGSNVSGGNVSGETTRSLLVSDVTDSDSGNYKVVVTNSDGSTTSTEVNLVVYQNVAYDPAPSTTEPEIPDLTYQNAISGSPNGVHYGVRGSYVWDYTNNQVYFKDSSGYGNTGWVAVSGGGGGGTNNQTGTGSPVGSATPDYLGQFYIDTTNPYNIWFSTGLDDTDWVMAVGNI